MYETFHHKLSVDHPPLGSETRCRLSDEARATMIIPTAKIFLNDHIFTRNLDNYGGNNDTKISLNQMNYTKT